MNRYTWLVGPLWMAEQETSPEHSVCGAPAQASLPYTKDGTMTVCPPMCEGCHMCTLYRQHSQSLQSGLQLHLYSEMVASSGRPAMISTLNLFS